MGEFYAWLGPKKSARIRLAVMDMWKPFRLATAAHAPQAAILFDKFHIMRHLGEALDDVRKSEYRRLAGRDRRYIKGQKYTLLSRKENLTLDGKRALKTLRGLPAAIGATSRVRNTPCCRARKSHTRRQTGAKDIAFGQQATQHSLCSQGEFWPAVEL